MKIANIGAKGMLGRELAKGLGNRHELLAWDIDEIDITVRPEKLETLAAERPDLIVNSAVFVDLAGGEADPPGKAWSDNAVGAQNLPWPRNRSAAICPASPTERAGVPALPAGDRPHPTRLAVRGAELPGQGGDNRNVLVY